MESATCNRCGESRPVSEFYVRKSGRLNPWCKSCYRDWYRSRGGYSTTRAATCHWCDQPFETPYAKSKFCSHSCKESSRAARRRGQPSRKPDRSCMWCGLEIPRMMRADARYCSADCNMQAHRKTRNLRRRYGTTLPRRSPLLNFAEFAETHEQRCGLCGEPVDMTLSHPDPLAASIDHILPRSRGGTDDLSNLQLAHFVCNWRKRDRSP